MVHEIVRLEDLSPSEQHGLQAMPAGPAEIYSVGISTAGDAEIYLAQADPQRHIVATTLDRDGADTAAARFAGLGLSPRIDVELQDVADPNGLPYPDNHFDAVYARLVLHYLTKQQLNRALSSLHRITRPGGLLYTVVRSQDCIEYSDSTSVHDAATSLTSYVVRTPLQGQVSARQERYFHTPATITEHLAVTGFRVDALKEHPERLYADFGRTVLSSTVDHLIEVTSFKSV